ncbi:hypothetical protein OIU77_026989 [Salix suchowensis]|uniref:Uncharacterized protein n=1 Tax=Salix suchowensis TaxID=1278906 RepID=A0ABQ9BS75_9ROSI|nr:hypothetical protein OIU77_026989 [Salix suchowensis]
MMISFSQPVCRVPSSIIPVSYVGSSYFLQNLPRDPFRVGKDFYLTEKTRLGGCKRKKRVVCGAGLIFPVDPWAPNIDSQSIASQLFAFSLFPYIGFLYYITKSKSAPKLTLFGFYFLLAFVGATIPAGIYAKVHYDKLLRMKMLPKKVHQILFLKSKKKINLLSSPCFLCSASGQPQVPVHQDFIPAECLRYWIIVKTVTRNHKYSA